MAFLTAPLLGYASWVGKKAEHNSALVDILYETGAVPFVRTNVPQGLVSADLCHHIPISNGVSVSSGGEKHSIMFLDVH